MIRNIDLQEVTDGKLYMDNDMARLYTDDCRNCHRCCEGMGESIILDPFDLLRLVAGTGRQLQDFIDGGELELNMVDGLILPNISMKKNGTCGFLDEAGRCSIHQYRTGICRLFPLGRIYDEKGFKYFLQENECAKKNRSKLKIKKWLDVVNLDEYNKYIFEWHMLIKRAGELIVALAKNDRTDKAKEVTMYMLNNFYVNSTEGLDDCLEVIRSGALSDEQAKNIYLLLRKKIFKAKNHLRNIEIKE